MLVAMLHCVADRGYRETTVADVVAGAGVSRSTFYAQFTDRESCFVATYEFAMRHVLDRLDAVAPSGHAGWRERVHTDLIAYLAVLADEPALATTLHVEVLAAGQAALERRVDLLGVLATRIANLNELARASQDDLRQLPPAVFALYTGGFDELIRDRLRTASADALPDLAKPLLDATYAIFGADRTLVQAPGDASSVADQPESSG